MKEYIFNEDDIKHISEIKEKAILFLEPVVHCSDCMYSGTSDCFMKFNIPYKPRGFCSWGEER